MDLGVQFALQIFSGIKVMALCKQRSFSSLPGQYMFWVIVILEDKETTQTQVYC